MIISADEMPGNAICMFLSKTAWTGAIAGVITMVVIARERYNTIVHPHGDRGKLTTRNLKVCLLDNTTDILLLNACILRTNGVQYTVQRYDLAFKVTVHSF